MEVKPADFRFTGSEMVVKDLGFMQSAYCLEITELRLVAMAIIVLRRNGDRAEFDPNVPVTLHANMYADLFNTSRQNAYQTLDSAAKSLHERRINWVDMYEEAKDGRKKMTKASRVNDLRWTSQCSYVESLGLVQLCFSPQIIPFLVHLDGNFAGYEIRNLIKLSTSYDFRMYELGVAWKGAGVAVFSKEDLRHRLGVMDENQFKTASNFGRMLNASLKKINEETDLTMAFEPNYAANIGTKGRHVKSYTMTVKTKKQQWLPQNHKSPSAAAMPEVKPDKPAKPKNKAATPPPVLAGENEDDFLNGLGTNAGLIPEAAPVQAPAAPVQAPAQASLLGDDEYSGRPFGLVKNNLGIQLWPNEDGSWDYEAILKYLPAANFQIVGMDTIPEDLLRLTEEYKKYSKRDDRLGLDVARNVIRQKIAKNVRRGQVKASSATNEEKRPVRKHYHTHLTDNQLNQVLNNLDFRSRYAPHGEGNPAAINQHLKTMLAGDLQKIPDLEDYLNFRQV